MLLQACMVLDKEEIVQGVLFLLLTSIYLKQTKPQKTKSKPKIDLTPCPPKTHRPPQKKTKHQKNKPPNLPPQTKTLIKEKLISHSDKDKMYPAWTQCVHHLESLSSTFFLQYHIFAHGKMKFGSCKQSPNSISFE